VRRRNSITVASSAAVSVMLRGFDPTTGFARVDALAPLQNGFGVQPVAGGQGAGCSLAPPGVDSDTRVVQVRFASNG
jgi:hypothetical protein